MSEQARSAESDAPCWCGSVHPKRPDNPRETRRVIGHLMLAHLRIPQVTAWLARLHSSHVCEECGRPMSLLDRLADLLVALVWRLDAFLARRGRHG